MVSKEAVQHVLDSIGQAGPISDDYWPGISKSILDDVVADVQECADNEEWNEDDVRLAVGRVLCTRLGIDKDGTPLDSDEEYELVELPCGMIAALFSNGRIDRSKVPEGLYVYDLRGSDDDSGEPCNIEKHVTVNHAGSIITSEPVPIPERGWLPLGDEGLNFTGESMTISQFKATYTERKQ